VYFEGRELKTYGEFVKAADLVVGQVYFRVSFVDDDTVVPELVPLVFVGRNLDADESGLYFQDVDSYFAGERYEAGEWTSPPESSDTAPLLRGPRECYFDVIAEREYSSVFEYEKALDQLLACSLRRQAWDGRLRPLKPPAVE